MRGTSMRKKSSPELKSNLKKETLCSVVFILFVLNFFNSEMIGIGLATEVGLNVEPALLATALNDGTGHVIITWYYYYENYKIQNYNIIIFKDNKQVLSNITYGINDTKNGEHSPIKGSYVWNVPIGQPEGMYTATLQIKAENLGVLNYSEGFGIAKDQSTLIISKFEDLNGNGIRDPGEKGLAGWQFTITSPNSDSFTYATKEDGNITISKVKVGIYSIFEIQQAGYAPTTPQFVSTYLSKNNTTIVKFGNRPLETNGNLILIASATVTFAVGLIILRKRRGKKNG
jgi:hypothetical protein